MTTRFENAGSRHSTARPIRLSALLAGMLGVLSLLALAPAASAQVPQETQTAISSEGAFSEAWVSGEHPDGRELRIITEFVHPEGTIEGTPALGELDLREPIGALDISAWKWNGRSASVEELCKVAANPTSYDVGHSIPAYGGGIAWTGQYFDIECNAGLGYDFWRVHFDHTWRRWSDGTIAPLPAREFKPEGASEGVEVGEEQRGSAITGQYHTVPTVKGPDMGTPGMAVGGWAWDNPFGSWAGSGAIGWVNGERLIQQSSITNVCGHRAGTAPECVTNGREGGTMAPRIVGMVQRMVGR